MHGYCAGVSHGAVTCPISRHAGCDADRHSCFPHVPGVSAELLPEADEVIAGLRAALDGYRVRPGSKAEEFLATQRDGILGLGRMAGMNIPQLAQWDPPAEALYDDAPPPSYLDLLSRRAPERPADNRTSERSAAREHDIAIEDHLIARDAETFMGWVGEQTGHVAWRRFRQHGQSLLIATVNRTTAERISGADLLYYHETRGSMVLVQYKKLNRHVGGYYYPDSDHNLAGELARMQEVDSYAAKLRKPTDDHRLNPDPSWIKLCPPEGVIPGSMLTAAKEDIPDA